MKHTSMASDLLDTAPKPCVLVVEDEFLIRFVVADQLREAGFRVLEAVNGEEAIDILSTDAPIDLVFTDVKMPGKIDGMELLKFIKATQPELPVLMTSGHQDPLFAVEAGAAGFLGKPCDLTTIISTVRAMLGKS